MVEVAEHGVVRVFNADGEAVAAEVPAGEFRSCLREGDFVPGKRHGVCVRKRREVLEALAHCVEDGHHLRGGGEDLDGLFVVKKLHA